MKELDEIRARLEAATPGPWVAITTGRAGGDHWYVCDSDQSIASIHASDGEDEDQRQPDAELIANAPTDLARLLAAVEAVEALATQWGRMADGDRHYASRIRYAITAALTPTPAVPGGAGEAGGAGVAHEGAGDVRGPEDGIQGLPGGDLVEWLGVPGKWRVIPSNVYNDKYVTIQRERGNRIITGVPCEELKRIKP